MGRLLFVLLLGLAAVRAAGSLGVLAAFLAAGGVFAAFLTGLGQLLFGGEDRDGSEDEGGEGVFDGFQDMDLNGIVFVMPAVN